MTSNILLLSESTKSALHEMFALFFRYKAPPFTLK